MSNGPDKDPDLNVAGGYTPFDDEGGSFNADVNLAEDLAELVRTRLERPSTIRFGRAELVNTEAGKLWQAIRFHTEQISFPAFETFVDWALCGEEGDDNDDAVRDDARRRVRRRLKGHHGFGDFLPGTDGYATLKTAAEIFLLLRCGVRPHEHDGEEVGGESGGEEGPWWTEDSFAGEESMKVNGAALVERLTTFLGSDRNSYIRSIIANVFPGTRNRDFSLSPFCPLAIGVGPCLLELIWSYWHEQGMQVQTMNAIALRFQNVRLGDDRDPLAELELDPLRPLSGFLWGYIQDEPHRLTVARRAYEYNHHYGLSLYGRAVRKLRPADPRSKFLQSFHDLLRAADQYFREASDNTVTADAFPLLIALRDLHIILAEGAGNQFRDLPWTARVEMLTEQWLLSRREMREFLRGRIMVPYSEGWMGAVDAMKKLQGWSDTNIMHFHDLGAFGERLLLSVRYIAWNTINDPDAASDWAVFWRPEIQGYIHSYRAATGVSLTDDVAEISRAGDPRYLQPSFHLRNRLLEQQPRESLPAESVRGDRLQLGPVSGPGARKR